MTTHKNTTIATLLLFSIGILFSCNTFAGGKDDDHHNDNKPYVVHKIGESYGGGIVFYVYDNGQHGLIAAKHDQTSSDGIQWYNGIYTVTGAQSDGPGSGEMNTTIIISTQISDNIEGVFAAKLAAEYAVQEDGITGCALMFPALPSQTCYGDWYLPSITELNLMYRNIGPGAPSPLTNVGVFINEPGHFAYWSSTETVSPQFSHAALMMYFDDGSVGGFGKDGKLRVRVIRAF